MTSGMSYTLLYYIKDNFSSLFVRKCVIYNQKTWRFVRNIVPLQAKSKINVVDAAVLSDGSIRRK